MRLVSAILFTVSTALLITFASAAALGGVLRLPTGESAPTKNYILMALRHSLDQQPNVVSVKKQTPKPNLDSTGMASASKKTLADSVKINRIVALKGESSESRTVTVDLVEDQVSLHIGVYNLLGRKVVDVYNGEEKSGRGKDFSFRIESLPNGFYICVVRGEGFRLAEKFFVSR